jgi:hypothetical protein
VFDFFDVRFYAFKIYTEEDGQISVLHNGHYQENIYRTDTIRTREIYLVTWTTAIFYMSMEMEENICTEILKICTINCVQRVETILHMNTFFISRIT